MAIMHTTQRAYLYVTGDDAAAGSDAPDGP